MRCEVDVAGWCRLGGVVWVVSFGWCRLGGVVRAVGPDHGVQKAGILRQWVGMVVTDTMSSQRARVLRKSRVMIAERGCGLHPKDFSEAYKIR